MHGITRPGRAHAQLVRFTRAVASAGLVTIVPEVPEWRELRLAPGLTRPTVAAAIRGLDDLGITPGRRVGIIGFSFGAPHAIATAADPRLRDRIRGAAGFGGYGELESTFHFMMTGDHEWEGRRYTHRPDPYGRWIVAANYLTAVPGYEDAVDVADALRGLAAYAGDEGAPSWDPVYDPEIERLRGGIAEARRSLFDAFAPSSEADRGRARVSPTSAEVLDALGAGLARAARRLDPEIDPAELLGRVSCPVSLLHGRADHLIPFTEGFRLQAALRGTSARLGVTRLFGHSAQDRVPLMTGLRELVPFVRQLDRMLGLV
jgi:pimeloyl-ACP methyl ester carboxylesterase